MPNLLLLLTAALWGFAFVAQRKGMESLDAFSFNAIRFALGALFVRFALARSFKPKTEVLRLPGLILFIAATLQQIGIIYTDAGSAGFITGLYVLFVPIFGIALRKKISLKIIVPVIFAVAGLYLINSFANARVQLGNILVLISALFWAIHVLVVDKYGKLYPTAVLAFDQFGVCALLSFIMAMFWRIFMHPFATLSGTYLSNIGAAALPILYGGLISVGIAYTLQIKAQKKAEPAAAAVILCLEGVFAMLGGFLLLSESISVKKVIGALLLLIAMLIVSIPKKVIDRISTANLSART